MTKVTREQAAFQAIHQSNVGPGAASFSAATASQREESEKSCPCSKF